MTILDGTTRSPDSFSDPIGKLLGTDVSEWPVVRFKHIQKTNFAILPDKVIEDLSADQKYAYKICLAVSKGSIEKDIQYLKVGPIVHSRWITLACRILHFYVSTRHPSENLVLLAKYCLNVYFPSWFETKRCNKIPDRSKFFNIMKRIRNLQYKEVSEIAMKVLQNNAYFAHPEIILVAIFGDCSERVRKMSVESIMCLRQKANNQDLVKFKPLKVNLQASHYYKMADNSGDDVEEPPLNQRSGKRRDQRNCENFTTTYTSMS